MVLGFTVRPGGSVDDIRILESGGDPRWVKAATAALAQWKFKQADHPTRKARRFTFKFDG